LLAAFEAQRYKQAIATRTPAPNSREAFNLQKFANDMAAIEHYQHFIYPGPDTGQFRHIPSAGKVYR
jgi:hypothetical protein